MDTEQNWQNTILEDIALHAPLDSILPKLVLMLEELLPGSRASILLLEGGCLRLAAAPSLSSAYNGAIDGLRIGPSVGSCGTAAYLAQPVLVSDIQKDPRWDQFRDLAQQEGLRACWSTPILARGQVLGTFAVYFSEPTEPEPLYLLWMQRAQHLACLAVQSDRAVSQLRESEERYRILVDQAKDGIFLLDKDRIILDVNRGACDSLQYSPSQLIGKPISLFNPDFRPERLPLEIDSDQPAHPEFQFESRHRRQDGSSFPVEVRGRLFRNHGEIRILALVSDISERRQAHTDLERQRQLLLEAQQIAGLGHFEMNLLTNQLTWSDSLYRIYGVDPETFTPSLEAFFEQVHSEDREPLQQAIQTALRERSAFHTRERILRPDGDIRVLESNGKVEQDERGRPTHLIGACLDITDRLETERALQRANEIARLTNWVYDLAGRTFCLQNGAAIPLERIVTLIHPADLEGAQQAWSQTLKEGLAYDQQFRLVRDGRINWIRVWANPSLGPNGQVEKLSGVTQDITHQRKLEDQFRESQKMEAVGRLAGGVAHDFNNLLTVIQGYTELLAAESDEETSQEALDFIRQASDRAATLTSQLLAFGRRTLVEPQVLDIHPLIQRSLALIRSLLGENIECQLEFAKEPCIIRIDPAQFEQMLMNLVVNARDAMPQGGLLRILSQRDPDLVRLVIADQGHGIDGEMLEHIFEPFFTTKGLGKGTGLGLAVVHGVVTRWGGSIHVDSSPGEGTAFHINFPVAHEQPQSPAPEPVVQAAAGAETLLWVEDEQAVRAVAGKALEGYGYKVLALSNPRLALEVEPGSIDLLITDVIMPGMSGIELAAQLRAQRPDLPVLFVSGYTDDRIQLENLRPGREAFLQKPFTPTTLASKVRQLLDERPG
ncbi:PAS domain S-box protein [bacterium]|nr:PAS domain S-box protein [bacterium]